MYKNVIPGMLGSIVAAAVLVFGFAEPTTHSLKVLWFSAICVLMVVRIVDGLYWYYRLKDTNFEGRAAITRFITGAVATALLWSVFAVGFFDTMSETEFAVTMAILCSIAAGSNSVLSGHKQTAILFVLLMLVPISSMAVIAGTQIHFYLGILGLMFSVALSMSGVKTARLTSETVALRNENKQLVDKMHSEIAQVDDVHKQLSDAYERLNEANSSLEKEVERRTEEIRELSNLDPLTQLYNRSAFIAQLKATVDASVERGHSIALLFIDLNGFKKINDTLGHQVGDAVLVEIANRLGAFANDYQAGRWGGDEFLMLLPYADSDTAMSVANALQARISQPLDVMSNQLHLDATIGIAMLPEHTADELELIQLADFAMFEQKKLQLSTPRMFTHDLFQSLKNVEALRDGLQEAINKKQLYLCYQPIICCKSKEPWSFEALLRWNFDNTLIRPDIFIPLAEQSGFIHDIGAWVLNRACIDASQWQHSPDASVSVNVSIIQLMDEDFIKILDKALETSKLPPERLHLEITESMFADNKQRVRDQLDAIKSRKVQVSIDDFGTGYSSLSQLQMLNFDVIKIDRSFVQNMQSGGEAIIRATLFIANEFGSQTVAEGIESEHEAIKLSEMGVDFLQGFMFAKPMTNDDLRLWVEKQETAHLTTNSAF
ncbi:putative bifunctional diguanylate cyclase/phosphodiesterase [Aliiglaciecola sp. M165]|uniref:putative bifunctional diguanylate cyclase/phosphodiesterase n=1 Tax=Aliiglaciecola sp. M165 TaxID=2593649 RepID=UPI0011808916|nr:EAL domain-containing protein [Aliiglaciecola sp. M165]TRY31832.1 EAL domain-containing protein [Aliiglaciecola sp. M165]